MVVNFWKIKMNKYIDGFLVVLAERSKNILNSKYISWLHILKPGRVNFSENNLQRLSNWINNYFF